MRPFARIRTIQQLEKRIAAVRRLVDKTDPANPWYRMAHNWLAKHTALLQQMLNDQHSTLPK